MVTTLRPNARDTPTSPIPTCGKPAAMTALPHPANVSQNVPMASAAYFFASIRLSPHICCCRVLKTPGTAPLWAHNLPNQGRTAPDSPHFVALLGPETCVKGGHPRFCLVSDRAQPKR